MWTLGKRNGENALKVVVKEYEGQVLIHLRHYFKAAGEDRWYPTKKGVALTLEEWDNLTESFVSIDAEVRRFRCKNSQVDQVPPKGIKRFLQTAFYEEEEENDCVWWILNSSIPYVIWMHMIKFC